MDIALEAVQLGKRYGRRWALQGCSFRLPAGGIVGLVGPNGAGKSTLLHLAVGLLRPDAGDVRVFGRSPYDDPAVLPDIGFVAQDTPLYRDFTAAELVQLGGRMNARWDAALARERLGQLGIPRSCRSASCPAASAPRSRSPWPWPSGPAFCCWTSRSPASTRSRVASSSSR